MPWIYSYWYKDELLYIGSTFDLSKRHRSHIYEWKKKPLQFHKYMIENNLTFDDLYKGVVFFDIKDKKTLELKETQFIKELKPLCNERMPRTTEEQTKKQYYKQYYIVNKDKIIERRRIKYFIKHLFD